MARFEHLLFVCTHERDADSSKPSCGRRGGKELLKNLKDEVVAHNLKGRVRVVSSGCLDFCSKGCALVALRAPSDDANHSPPGESWYTHLTAEDAGDVFAKQVLANDQQKAHLETTRQILSTKR